MHTDMPTDRKAGRQADRQTGRQAGRQPYAYKDNIEGGRVRYDTFSTQTAGRQIGAQVSAR